MPRSFELITLSDARGGELGDVQGIQSLIIYTVNYLFRVINTHSKHAYNSIKPAQHCDAAPSLLPLSSGTYHHLPLNIYYGSSGKDRGK